MTNAPVSSDLLFSVSETRHQALIRQGQAQPVYMQGAYPFAGRGFFEPQLLHTDLQHTVPEGATAEVVYFRAGNLSDDLIYVTLWANDRAIRYFPIGPKHDCHVTLAIVESHPAGTQFELRLAAPKGLSGSIVIDIGLLEIRAEA
ncbi:MAG: molybdopterin oxidoreductase [Fimbriimonas sp.]